MGGMAKRQQILTVHLNMLVPNDGTLETLRAIAYFRGESGEFAAPARDFLIQGIERFRAGLSDRDKARFAEILHNVKVTEELRKAR
jgi:hypothetical protein